MKSRYFALCNLFVVGTLLTACSQSRSPTPQIAPDVAITTPTPAPEMQSGVVLYGQIHGGTENTTMLKRDAFIGLLGSTTKAEYIRPIENRERYGKIDNNPVQTVVHNPVSTFSIDVDTGSYANVRRMLQNGSLPPSNAVRIEELMNYFGVRYRLPENNLPFAVHTETVDSPWQKNAKLIRIGIQAQDLQSKTLPPANLVFLVDVSGSMSSDDKLPLVKHTLRLLTEQLRPQDKVSIVTYASGEKLVLPPTSGKEKDTILRAINELHASGSTAGEKGIRMAYQAAQDAYVKNGINRILLATDGDFNVGITSFDALKDLVAEKRKSGISLTTLGFGTGNYNEHLMEQLADAGDGNYSYIDNHNEAKKVLQRQLSSTLATVAQDVKIQVEFNPATVKEYRLVGYENRLLKQEDFNNDRVDAGDIGAGHSVTALYEIIPVGQQGWLDTSRYQTTPTVSGSQNEYAFVKLRYKLPNQKDSKLISQAIGIQSKPIAQADTSTRLTIAAAAYGQALRGGQYNGKMTWDDIIQLAQTASKPDPYGLHEEFVALIQIAKSLSSKPR
ncbi:MAG: VWA domain-containing protein [Alysiella sp.]|uniref:vWA domain-containing protein n=1 Tax=Alysiella sp. TaxID=1872483 RepID=UPI0026DDAC23|nr:VWA domain-containing protein [Alysiella sp.]MDO4433669.1 VWA domain-containing protein [Alysiella sp.]